MTAEPAAPTKTRLLGEFGAALTPDALPEQVVHSAKRALVDWLAAALAGAREPAAAKLHRVIASVAPEMGATVLGYDGTTSAPFAALANAYSSHLLDFDDVYNPARTTIHLGSCTWPVVLAIGQTRPVSGRAALAAYVAGFETGARVACAAGVGHYESGWHVTGTAGHLASAAAAANVLRLSPEAATHALGCAATQAAGVREVYGSDTKALHPGKAAMDGVLSGLLAEQGFTSTDTALEGPRGLLVAVSPDPDPDLLVEGLRTHWHVLENGHKLYPSASLTHPAIDAAIALAATHRPDPDTVVSIEVRMAPFAATVTALGEPKSGPDAKFSTAHCVAVALRTGMVRPSDFTDAVVADPSVAALRNRVTVIPDEGGNKRGCAIRIELADGGVLEHSVEQNRGTPADPLSDAELEAKLLASAEQYVDTDVARTLIDQCWAFDGLSDAGGILRLLAPAVARAAT